MSYCHSACYCLHLVRSLPSTWSPVPSSLQGAPGERGGVTGTAPAHAAWPPRCLDTWEVMTFLHQNDSLPSLPPSGGAVCCAMECGMADGHEPKLGVHPDSTQGWDSCPLIPLWTSYPHCPAPSFLRTFEELLLEEPIHPVTLGMFNGQHLNYAPQRLPSPGK